MNSIKNLTDWRELERLMGNSLHSSEEIKIDEQKLKTHLLSRVRGQDAVVNDLAKLVRLQYARQSRDKPVCNLLLLGPTGTGKTEIAKALAEHLFQDEKNMIRFDCSELSGEHSKDRLIGMPNGYVGSEMGGQLTRPVLANPQRVILFDEIEKAYPGVFDLFLQLLGEGRLTEQSSGKTVDFSKCIFIFTSNAQWETLAKIQKEFSEYHERLNAVKSHLADTRVFKPELLGRLDRVYLFDQLKPEVVAEIALMKIIKLAEAYSVQLEFVAPLLIIKALESNQKISRFGVRELERIIFDLFAPGFANAKSHQVSKLRVEVRPSGGLHFKRGAA